jgi:hypothetical protein
MKFLASISDFSEGLNIGKGDSGFCSVAFSYTRALAMDRRGKSVTIAIFDEAITQQ